MPAATPVFTPNAPPPAGHYSQAMIHNDVVYVAGQLPITPEGKKLITASLADQTMQVLQNLEAILKAAGSSPQHTLSVTIYITDVANWGTVNEVYTRFFGDHKPARAIVPIKELHYGLQIEVQAIAAVIG